MANLKPTHEGRVNYFRRPGSDKIHIRFSIMENGKSKQLKRSTGETSYKKARAAADRIYMDARVNSVAGISNSSSSFRKIAKAYIKEYESLVEAGERKDEAYRQEKSRVERFMIGFFGDQPIERIRQADINKYVMWRKTCPSSNKYGRLSGFAIGDSGSPLVSVKQRLIVYGQRRAASAFLRMSSF